MTFKIGLEGEQAIITTVTNSTLTLIKEPNNVNSLAFISAIILMVLLILREMISAKDNYSARAFKGALNIGIVPLLMVFILLAGLRIVEGLH